MSLLLWCCLLATDGPACGYARPFPAAVRGRGTVRRRRRGWPRLTPSALKDATEPRA